MVKEVINLFQTMRRVNNMNYSHILIIGDLNFSEINWDNQVSSKNENLNSSVLEGIEDLFLHQHVKRPTRYRGNQTPPE